MQDDELQHYARLLADDTAEARDLRRGCWRLWRAVRAMQAHRREIFEAAAKQRGPRWG